MLETQTYQQQNNDGQIHPNLFTRVGRGLHNFFIGCPTTGELREDSAYSQRLQSRPENTTPTPDYNQGSGLVTPLSPSSGGRGMPMSEYTPPSIKQLNSERRNKAFYQDAFDKVFPSVLVKVDNRERNPLSTASCLVSQMSPEVKIARGKFWNEVDKIMDEEILPHGGERAAYPAWYAEAAKVLLRYDTAGVIDESMFLELYDEADEERALWGKEPKYLRYQEVLFADGTVGLAPVWEGIQMTRMGKDDPTLVHSDSIPWVEIYDKLRNISPHHPARQGVNLEMLKQAADKVKLQGAGADGTGEAKEIDLSSETPAQAETALPVTISTPYRVVSETPNPVIQVQQEPLFQYHVMVTSENYAELLDQLTAGVSDPTGEYKKMATRALISTQLADRYDAGQIRMWQKQVDEWRKENGLTPFFRPEEETVTPEEAERASTALVAVDQIGARTELAAGQQDRVVNMHGVIGGRLNGVKSQVRSETEAKMLEGIPANHPRQKKYGELVAEVCLWTEVLAKQDNPEGEAKLREAQDRVDMQRIAWGLEPVFGKYQKVVYQDGTSGWAPAGYTRASETILALLPIDSQQTQVAALQTLEVETAEAQPIVESGTDTLIQQHLKSLNMMPLGPDRDALIEKISNEFPSCGDLVELSAVSVPGLHQVFRWKSGKVVEEWEADK